MSSPEKIFSPSGMLLENVLTFAGVLRSAGFAVSTGQVLDFVRALDLVDVGTREQVFAAARALLVNRYEQLPLFESLFNAFWLSGAEANRTPPRKAPRAARHETQQKPVLVTYMASKVAATDPELDIADKSSTWSDLDYLQRKDFSRMTSDELVAVKRLIEKMRWSAVLRRSHRRVPSRAGEVLHMRRVLASAVRHGGVPLHLAWLERKIKQRPIVLIADISGSMEKYSRLVLQFFFSVVQSLKRVECFVFGTRLTRISQQLRHKHIDQAVTDAAAEVVDWAGGTRIGESLATFNYRWTRRTVQRGAVVVIVSDGWEQGDPTLLRKETRWLQLRCHRLIWLNPHAGKTNYQPQVQGMVAALPYIDDFLPIDNMHSLGQLALHLGSLR